tara:strand:+ start:3412 stop:4395 length:984 start_codon:yes stop_codon:yes gene_type:complete
MENKFISNKYNDFFFIKFPVWIPILYWYFINLFPDYSLYALILLLLIGEVHFGITFAFFFDKNYSNLLKNEKYTFVLWPLMLVFFVFFFGYFFSVSAVLFLILLFNFYHVNRQSVGIFKIYQKKQGLTVNKLFIISIYFFSFLLCSFGLLKFIFFNNFYLINEAMIIKYTLLLLILSLTLLSILMYVRKEFNFDNILNFITGVGMFLPVFFTDKIIHVFAMGVAMHYVQYIYITKSVLTRKYNIIVNSSEKNFYKYFSPVIIGFYLLFYSILMVYFSNLNLDYKGEKFGIYIVPIVFQLIHFYLDMYIWQFSKEHTKKNLSPYLFAK